MNVLLLVCLICQVLSAVALQAPFVIRDAELTKYQQQATKLEEKSDRIQNCLLYPGEEDAIVDFNARCPVSLSNTKSWKSTKGDYSMDIAGLRVDRKSRCPSVYFKKVQRTINLDISPKEFPALTVELLVRPKSLSNRAWLISNDNGNWGRSVTLYDSRARGVSAIWGTFPTRTSVGDAPLNKWIHVVATFENGQSCKIYRNFYVQDVGTAQNPDGTRTLFIGGAQWNKHFIDADIGLVRVYADRLSDDEVQALYHNVADCVAEGCSESQNKRNFGGGFSSGTAKDIIQPVTSARSSRICKEACAAHPECRQYVWSKTDKTCTRLRTPFTGAASSNAHVSGRCGK